MSGGRLVEIILPPHRAPARPHPFFMGAITWHLPTAAIAATAALGGISYGRLRR